MFFRLKKIKAYDSRVHNIIGKPQDYKKKVIISWKRVSSTKQALIISCLEWKFIQLKKQSNSKLVKSMAILSPKLSKNPRE